jgi:murein DD-endopeptidase MepM/ murein hydrolase activator NlpD
LKRESRYSALYSILYYIGIQTLRFCKRVYRRVIRPVQFPILKGLTSCRLFIHQCLFAASRQYRRMRVETRFSIRCLRRAKSHGVIPCMCECARIAGQGVKRYRHFFRLVAQVVAPVVAVCVLIFTIQYWSNQNYGLVLAYEGEPLAAIPSEQTFEQAHELVNERMVYDAASASTFQIVPRYTLTAVDTEYYATPQSLCEKLIASSGGKIEEATGLYVDGKLVGAVKSQTDLAFLLQSQLKEARAGNDKAEADFVQKVECITGLYPTAAILPSDGMKSLLLGSVNDVSENQNADSNFEGSTSLQNIVYKEDGQALGEGKPLLTVMVTVEETYETVLPFKTMTDADEREYTDFSKITQQGADGLEQCTDRVSYIDGVEVSREVVNRTTLKEVQDQIITVGTKQRSGAVVPGEQGTGRSTCELMWPVPYTRNITSLYEMRWGKMHTGLDISMGGITGQPIVASDGGTVAYVKYSGSGYGYHLAINHGNGVTTLYAHCSKIYVTPGQKVSKGQIVAAVGRTGDSTGPHLHFEVIVNGVKKNPLDYLK